MPVERKGYLNAKLLHDNLAGAIGETPAFICKLLKDIPSSAEVLVAYVIDVGQFATEKPPPMSNANFVSPRTRKSVNVSSMTKSVVTNNSEFLDNHTNALS